MYSHRLSTIMRADRIVVMKDGSIIEQGSHDDLLRLKGKYFDLWANQIQLLSPDDKSNNKPDDEPDGKSDGKPARTRSNSPHKDNARIEFSRSRSRSKSPQKDKEDAESSELRPKSPHKYEVNLESSMSKSKSPQKDMAGIVNDLGPERNQ